MSNWNQNLEVQWVIKEGMDEKFVRLKLNDVNTEIDHL